MRVLVLCRYGPLGSTSRLRFYQYLPHLERMGISLTVSPLLEDDYVSRLYANRPQPLSFLVAAYYRRIRSLLQASQYDLVWVEKEFLPFLPAMVPALLKTPYVVDYDDAAFHRYDLHPSRLVRALLGRKIARVMRGAAIVIAGNDYIADYARQAGAGRIEILPTVVDLARYAVPPQDHPGHAFRVGWIGAPVTVGYLRAIEPALRQLMEEDANTELQIIGASDPFDGRLPVATVKWSEEMEVRALQQLDVGIMPLPDEPFERGKCGYKLIQYMACGLPVIASPVGVNTRIVADGENGFLADDQDAWMEALRTLRRDADLRRRMGQVGRERVEARYGLQAHVGRLVRLLESAADRKNQQ